MGVKEVVDVNGSAVTYRFTDGSVATHDVRWVNGGPVYGPLNTVNSAQRLAVAMYNDRNNAPVGGWL